MKIKIQKGQFVKEENTESPATQEEINTFLLDHIAELSRHIDQLYAKGADVRVDVRWLKKSETKRRPRTLGRLDL